ncbi:MAG: sialidase family protein [Streptosporangiales bacterium]
MRCLSRRAGVAALSAAALTALAVPAGSAGATTVGANVAVSPDKPYVKANGRPITPGDAIRFCGDNLRQQNEPSAAVNPNNTDIIVAGSNDYCTVEGAGGTWTGFYRSTDSGDSWQGSLLPGYPTDDSPEGQASPLHQLGITNAGDPVQEWDRHGRLFYMGNAFNRTKPQNGSVWVATYDRNASHYVRTVIVGRGTPAISGRFNDKTSLGVDRGVDSPYDGNVYAAWSLFQGNGNNAIYFVRSTDHGKTFSHPTKISESVHDNQFADIAVTRDGTVYVTWRQFESRNGQRDAVVYAKSTDGGKTFTKPRVAVHFRSFDAADTYGSPEAAARAHEEAFENADGPEAEAGEESVGAARDCGSGPLACESGFTFFRHDTQVRSTADPSAKGDPDTVYVVYDGTKPGSEVASDSTYNTADPAPDGSLRVSVGRIFFTKTTDGGKTWSEPAAISDPSAGHQLFPDINADGGYLHALWHDSRNDACYSVQNPPGNCSATDSAGKHTASPTGGMDTYGATSTDGGATWSVSRLTDQSHQPNYEMFGDRRVPFQGDYNYVSSVGAFAYNVWNDNREVRPGDDPRYDGGEGFDVHQCRAPNPDGDFGPDTCPNAGGLDQDIFGAATTG